jgi:esterase
VQVFLRAIGPPLYGPEAMLAHQSRGEGPRVVVGLHGFLGSGRNLGALVREWTARDPELRVLTPDLPGHGRSPPMPEPPSAEGLADAVLTWMTDMGVERADFLGHSLGGRVALLCRARHPERVGRLDLLDISPGPIPVTDTDRVVDILAAAPARGPDRAFFVDHLRTAGLSPGLVEWLSMNLEREGDGAVAWRIDRAQLARYHYERRGQSLWWTLDGDTAGVRLLRGGRSDYVSAEDAAELGRRGVPVDVIEEAGHFVHVDATARVVDWLASTGSTEAW